MLISIWVSEISEDIHKFSANFRLIILIKYILIKKYVKNVEDYTKNKKDSTKILVTLM